MIIRPLSSTDYHQLPRLIANFRVALAELKGITRAPDLDPAARELVEYVRKDWPVFVAENEAGMLMGYLVCRVDGDVLWVESLYVDPAFRRLGIAGQLYEAAEALSPGGDTLYNWVHPNNDAIIGFLRKRGYTVLNLIEVRRPYEGETLKQTINVGKHNFNY